MDVNRIWVFYGVCHNYLKQAVAAQLYPPSCFLLHHV